ncbi:MAG: hypothetical protein B5M53_09290 [Candidatus Cloacimonas sp. 4484_209]|nr:MAG: hypothetical protein B5M53_09290 [Candidatus Cloacimonas sp. 4484_209]
MKRLCLLFFSIFMFHSLLSSQEFGQNKIQYKNFDWKSTTTPHFIIYYYQGEDELVRFAAQVAEDSYDRLKDDMSHSFTKRVPIIIYNSHNDFEQTNVTLSLIEESVGGFTEIFKNRVVVPFNGSYEGFRHVINHELTHAFQFDVLYGSHIGSVMQSQLTMNIPLWVIEGLAEFESLYWDSGTESYIRDAVVNDRLIPIQKLNYSYGYEVYKEGQSIYKFIADTYGRKKIGELFHTIRQKRDFEKALKSTLGLSVERLNKEWSQSLKKKYWPQYDKMDELDKVARRLTDHKRQGNAYNVSPAISPDGLKIAYITDKDEYTEILIMSAINGEILKKVVKGSKSKTFESLHLFRPGISWSKNGKKIAFAAKAGKEDVIYIMDAEKGNILSSLKPKCDALYSPSFSPDGRTIVYTAVKDGRSDICTIDIKTKKINRLTNDTFDDRDPVFSPDGNNIVFSSDRGNFSDSLWHYGNYALFEMKRDGSDIEQLTDRASTLRCPVFADSGKDIIFVSDKAGVNNLYMLKIDSLKIYRLTNVFGGITSPSLSLDSRKLVFTGYEDGGWDIYIMRNPLDSFMEEPGERVDFHKVYTQVTKVYKIKNGKKACLHFSTDWAGGTFVFASGYGFRSLMEIAVSDVLGNNRFYFAFDLYSKNILDSNFQLLYWFLPKRWDLGATIFQEKNYYLIFPTTSDESIVLMEETLRGGGFVLQYPIDRFHRFEFETDLFSVQQSYTWETESGIAYARSYPYYIFLPTLSWIRDTALWGTTGPVNGERWKFSYAKSVPQIASHSFDYSILYGDIRDYFRIKRGFTFATRLFGFGSWGKDALYYPLGGSENVRGYDYRSFYGRKAGFVNFELRYPFIEQLKMGFPLPLNINGIRGVAFLDIGGVTDNLEDFRTAVRTDTGFKLKDLKCGFGTGIRMNITITVLKFDIAWNTDLEGVSKMHMHFSLGSEF